MHDATSVPERIPACPRCQATHVVRNGDSRGGKPSYRCRACGRRFVEHPAKGPVTEERQALVRRLLGERLSLRAIARVAGVSRSWLQAFVNDLYQKQTPHDPGPLKKKRANSSSKPTNSGVS
jgi:transposase-like protein